MRRRTVVELLERARSKIDRLAPDRAHAELASGALLVDTRCADARRDEGVVPGSVHVPLSVLYWRLDPASDHREPDLADPERRVILFCAHGYSSSLAAATLRDLGYRRATDVIGGFQAWAEAGLPVEHPRQRAGRSRATVNCRPGGSPASARGRRRPTVP